MTIQHERRADHITEQNVHDKHHEYIAALIAREQQKIAWRQSIIDKTLASLVWSVLVGGATIAWTYVKEHWR